jgi:3-keto-5-aminohexanoate cleavage enzyme
MNCYYWQYADSFSYMKKVREGMPALIVCCACNGGIQGKEYNENIPETPDEIADSVFDAYKAGASMVHVHPRDKSRIHCTASSAEDYYEVNKKIRERCSDIIINNTTGGAHHLSFGQIIRRLDAKPEMASLNLTPDMGKYQLRERPSHFLHPRAAVEYDDTWAVTYKLVHLLASEMKVRGIKPELEIYHPGGQYVVQDLIGKNQLTKPYWIQTVMGYQTSSYPSVQNTIDLLREFPNDTLWLCSGMGAFQLPLTTLSTLMGGHVRVGLEDNIYYKRGEKARSNAQLVQRAVRIATELNREIATPSEARRMLGISSTPSSY